MSQQTTLANLLAPHFEQIGEQSLTAGASVVSVTTVEGTTLTSTTRFAGAEVEAQHSTDAAFAATANTALLNLATDLGALTSEQPAAE